MFEPLFESVSSVLAGFYSLTNSYGGAIVLLTLAVMIVTAPLTLKSTRSMVGMQRVQPQLKILQEKYKDDRERLNQEMMAFYKENNINPLSGCLPILIQAPIFLLLYRVLRGITERQTGTGGGVGHIAGQLSSGTNVTPWSIFDQPFMPDHLDTQTQLYKSLVTETKMDFFGMDLAISPKDALSFGLWASIPFMLLMVGMFVAQVIQNRQIQGRTRNSTAPVNSQQQFLMKILPFMLPVFSFSFPAGLGLYYFVQGLCRIGLQSHITRTVYGDDAPGPIETTATEKPKSSSGSSPKAKALAEKKATDSKPKSKPNPKSQAAKNNKSKGNKSGGARKSGTPRAGAPRRSGEAPKKKGN